MFLRSDRGSLYEFSVPKTTLGLAAECRRPISRSVARWEEQARGRLTERAETVQWILVALKLAGRQAAVALPGKLTPK